MAKIQTSAVLAIHEAAEAYVGQLPEHSNICACQEGHDIAQ